MRIVVLAVMIVPTSAAAAPLLSQQVGDVTFLPRSPRDMPEFGAFVTFQNELYFTASIGDDRYRLFKTDGSNLTEFNVDPEFHIGTQFVEFQNQLYFRGNGGDGVELFRTDGHTLATYDLSSADYGSAPRSFSVVGDRLYFEANLPDGNGGTDPYLMSLHETTIAPLGKMSVMSSYPWHQPVGSKVYFTSNGPDGFELHRTDGTSVELVLDANPGADSSDPWPAAIDGDNFYFSARGPAGRELYRSDDNSVVKLPLPAEPDVYGGPSNFVPFGDNIYFIAKAANGYELFRTNEDAVTELDLNPGPASSAPFVGGHDILDDQLLIPADGPNGDALFIFDEAGNLTRQFDFHPREQRGAFYFHHFQGEAYFEATGPDGQDLYKTDGNTLTKFEIVPDDVENGGVAIWDAVEFQGELYFAASTLNGGELVKTDGERITKFDLNPGAADSWPSNLQLVGDHLVFQARDASGYHIFCTDGTNIERIAELTPYGYDQYEGAWQILPSATSFGRLGNQLFFLGNTSDGFRLHRVSVAPEPSGWLLFALAAIVCRPRLHRKIGAIRHD